MDTIIKDCEWCGCTFDYLPNAELRVICDECIESECEKCGGEGGNMLVGDETFWRCGDCGHADMNK